MKYIWKEENKNVFKYKLELERLESINIKELVAMVFKLKVDSVANIKKDEDHFNIEEFKFILVEDSFNSRDIVKSRIEGKFIYENILLNIMFCIDNPKMPIKT